MKVTVCRFTIDYCKFTTLFPIAISLPFPIFPGEDEALKDFLAKDREEELKQHKTSMAETRKLVRDIMQKDWGCGEVVHPEKVKELNLQVAIPFLIQLFNSVTFLKIHAFSIFISLFITFSVFSGFT